MEIICADSPSILQIALVGGLTGLAFVLSYIAIATTLSFAFSYLTARRINVFNSVRFGTQKELEKQSDTNNFRGIGVAFAKLALKIGEKKATIVIFRGCIALYLVGCVSFYYDNGCIPSTTASVPIFIVLLLYAFYWIRKVYRPWLDEYLVLTATYAQSMPATNPLRPHAEKYENYFKDVEKITGEPPANAGNDSETR